MEKNLVFAKKSQPPPPEPSESLPSPPLPPSPPPPPPPPPALADSVGAGSRRYGDQSANIDLDPNSAREPTDTGADRMDVDDSSRIGEENANIHANRQTNRREKVKQKDKPAVGDQLEELLDEIESENSSSGKEKAVTNQNPSSTKPAPKKTASRKSAAAAGPKERKQKKSPRINAKLPKFPLPPADVGIHTQDSSQLGPDPSPPNSPLSSHSSKYNSSFTSTTASSSQDAPKRTSGSAYSVRPGGRGGAAGVCLDLTSFKFVPDDQKRVHIVLRKMLGNPFDMPDLSYTQEKGHTVTHDFPLVHSQDITQVPASKAPGSSVNINSKQYITVVEFASTPRIFQTIARKESTPFILVTMQENSPPGTRWEVPHNDVAHDFINETLGSLYLDDSECVDAYQKTGKWGLLTLIFLSTASRENMDNFRRAITDATYKNMVFDSFPKDALTNQMDISILLRSSMKAWNIEIIPKVLFKRNADCLAGALKVVSTSYFPNGEVSHKGESKADWRKINLAGDDQFMRCLRNFPEGHAFVLGVDAVQIRGGLRPSDPPQTPTLGKRQWVPTPLSAPPVSSTPHPLHNDPQPQILYFNPTDEAQPSGTGGNNAGRGKFPKRGRANHRGRGRGKYNKNK